MVKVLCVSFLLAFLSGQAATQQPPAWGEAVIATEIREIIASVDESTDLVRLKLTFDRYVDPNIDVDASVTAFDEITRTVELMASSAPTDATRLGAIQAYLYRPGPWNEYRAYVYDHDDPLGTHVPNKLLPNYISSREGNCISMPMMMILLGDRLDLDVTAATAPLHVFMRYTDHATGQTFNIEATSGGHPARDAWYHQNLPMTQTAIDNGVYMRSLPRQKLAALIATVVLEHLIDEGQYIEAIGVGSVLLEFYPEYAYILAKMGDAFASIMDRDFHEIWPDPANVPPDMRDYYNFLANSNHRAFSMAEQLGWQPEGGLNGSEDAPTTEN